MTNRAVAFAVALAQQATLGLVCDPLGGLVELPCVFRNATGAAIALAAIEMALAGITFAIPADEELIQQLIGLTYTLNLKGAIQLEKKEDMMKRGVASPDRADALALTFSYPVARTAHAGGQFPQPPKIESEYNPFADKQMAA